MRVEVLKRLHQFFDEPDSDNLLSDGVRDGELSVKLAALVAANSWCLGQPLAPALRDAAAEQFDHDDARVREAAVFVISGIPRHDRVFDASSPIAEQLLALAEYDVAERVRAMAVHALAVGNARSDDVEACLLRCSQDQSAWVRAAAIRWLAKRAGDEPLARAAVQAALRDEDGAVREAAMTELHSLGLSRQQVAAALVSGLADETAGVRGEAVKQLPVEADSFSEFHPWMARLRNLTASEDVRVGQAVSNFMYLIEVYDPPPR
jgi:HEAT repeats